MEHSSRVDRRILALRARAQTLDLERKAFIHLVEQLKEEISEYQKREKQGVPAPAEAEGVTVPSLQTQGTKDEGRGEGDCVPSKAGSDEEDGYQDSEALHRRCWEVIENSIDSQLLPKLHKLEQEHKALVECSEDLESTPGETRIQSKQEKEHFEVEVEGLQQQVISLEAELLQVQKNKAEMNGDEQALSGAQEMQEMLKSCQETIEKLGSQLGERRERRRQLASELELLREDLKAEKKVLGSQGSELLHEKEQIENLEQRHEDLCTDEKRPEDQIRNSRDEQELLCPELPGSNKKRKELEKQSNEDKQSRETACLETP
ncbi:uveal autoantigen with coiled-coil domains and ankyrin repeats protein-like [Neopsephotus bourkii]|uniref:uveal autoantigen with coiled-coil domains and ankyrin repeats protein-like n=1 Tax=Neopsephotus bourkii TaxID=309878 RepID=UPI002AA59EE9|nr:uveal autoantigen with coiled-coil domains and ankyrin repeats protein-like [Neopsephotus bourkii]